MTELNVGDRVMFRRVGKLYGGTIKSVQGEKIEIDDSTIELIIVAKSIGTIADNLTFTEKKDENIKRRKFLKQMSRGFVP